MSPDPSADAYGFLRAILAAEEVLVLEQVGGVECRVVGTAPRWCDAWSPAELTRPLELFPFLEAFWPEAEGCWQGAEGGGCRGGPWAQALAPAGGRVLDFEVVARRLEGRHLLLIRQLGVDHAERQQLLQRARELVLTHERLASEIEKKEVLLHCIVHDLNGPLAGMLGCLELLNREALSTVGREVVAIGLTEAARQSNRIQELLECFAAEVSELTGAPDPSGAAVDLRDAAQRVLGGLRPAFLAKGVSASLRLPSGDDGAWRVQAEASRLERVYYNLLENALRHSPRQGRVIIDFARREQMLECSVLDHGTGIDPQAAGFLFEKFGRGRKGGRVGLGLFFCRMTVERWGGVIGCENRAEGGARFWFRLREGA